ncbi:MAG: lytic transglycosylase domain-containing protein [Ignavibacteriae bacterium]|nr:lytic transglycosylase domain-containing protein [Ignavibacteriota bacterium]
MKKYFISLTILSFVFSISVLKAQNLFSYLSSLKLPNHLEFCGEKIPLDIPEVKERAEREFYLLLQQPGQIILYIKRSGRYFPIFEKTIREKNLPDDLKYLSVAESALYMSRSSKGAVGLWQFMPGTARAYDLQVDDYVDERRHPEKSTEAALEYLKDGYKQHKSWILSAAGYNMGNSNVASHLDFQNGNNFFDLFLNEETSRYILRIVVIKEIMSNPEKYGFKIEANDKYTPDNVKYIDCNEEIPNLSKWATDNGSTYKDVKLLNPWILDKKLPKPSKGDVYKIAVPMR